MTARISDYQLYRAASNEVSGFAHMEADLDMIPMILRCVYEGRCFISPHLAARVLHILSSGAREFQAKTQISRKVKFLSKEDPAEYLSKMELRILSFIGEGKSSDEIAMNLGLAVGTVRNYISAVMHKTGMHNRLQLARYSFCYGLVPLNPG
jgi:DNA-binding NarL/FixJ family response regulator